MANKRFSLALHATSWPVLQQLLQDADACKRYDRVIGRRHAWGHFPCNCKVLPPPALNIACSKLGARHALHSACEEKPLVSQGASKNSWSLQLVFTDLIPRLLLFRPLIYYLYVCPLGCHTCAQAREARECEAHARPFPAHTFSPGRKKRINWD